MEARPSDLILVGAMLGIALGLLVALVWFRAFLSEKRVTFLEKRELPDFFPRDFLRHSFAVQLLIELLKANREGRKEAHFSQMAKWIPTSRESASNTIDYLQREGFVEVRPTIKKKFASLTELGEKAGLWLEKNLSPSVLSYLEESYPQDSLIKLLRGRKRHA